MTDKSILSRLEEQGHEAPRVKLKGEAGANRTLAYFRRLIVADKFIDAAVLFHGKELDVQQKTELAKWKAELGEMQAVLVKRIESYFQRDVQVRQR